MQKTYPDIENKILVLLRDGPMKQVEIGDCFPLDKYIEVGHAVRNLAARGAVEREKCGATYMVRLGHEVQDGEHD